MLYAYLSKSLFSKSRVAPVLQKPRKLGVKSCFVEHSTQRLNWNYTAPAHLPMPSRASADR